MLKATMQKVMDWLFPPRCAFCGNLSRSSVCPNCAEDLPFIKEKICPTCGFPLQTCHCRSYQKPLYDAMAAPFFYDGVIRTAILRMKNGNAGVHIPLAKYMADCMNQFSVSFDYITCVPQSAKSAQRRGFNQAELLAKQVSELTGIPFLATLKCVKYSTAQKTLGAAERAENIKGSFAVSIKDNIKGCRLLLIDDIKTTGSTANEAAKVLKDAGAETVCLFCAAFTRQSQ